MCENKTKLVLYKSFKATTLLVVAIVFFYRLVQSSWWKKKNWKRTTVLILKIWNKHYTKVCSFPAFFDIRLMWKVIWFISMIYYSWWYTSLCLNGEIRHDCSIDSYCSFVVKHVLVIRLYFGNTQYSSAIKFSVPNNSTQLGIFCINLWHVINY